MNQTMQNIMLFINEHTLLLIGICIFLILVLIGYLIDNSVKSKRIRKDIKNPDQVPENIKDEIIKEAEEKNVIKENTLNNDLGNQIELPNIQSEINTPVLEPKQEENNIALENDFNQEQNDLNIPDINSSKDELTFDIPTTPISEPIADPDANIMMPDKKSEYTNDKKLSEILFSMNYSQEEPTNNIFTNNESENIVINNSVDKNDVQIQNNDISNSTDELDRIMRKLSTMNNNVEDDNYTNIF